MPTPAVDCPGVRADFPFLTDLVIKMRADIHPKYEAVTVTCSCGNVFETRSTTCKNFSIDVCSACHPFYTGTQKVVDTGGRIDKFKQRFGARSFKK